jgi:hypothetical protein
MENLSLSAVEPKNENVVIISNSGAREEWVNKNTWMRKRGLPFRNSTTKRDEACAY